MSTLMRELYQMLVVRGIRTSPYDPQTEGMVERLNQMLKLMLRKVANDERRNWDKLIPLILFAYRDAVQESTGYTPFELACTHEVKGLLDVPKGTWVPTAGLDEDIAKYVGQVHARMKEISEEVQKNLDMAQKQQKHWYDKRSRKRELKAGEHVLLLLPDSTSKFRRQWRGRIRSLDVREK